VSEQQEPPGSRSLEERVTAALVTRGIALAQRNLGLQIEQIGGMWLVSLVDLTTGRAEAADQVAALPADRDAAVVTVTSVVSDLEQQVPERGERAATQIHQASRPAALAPPSSDSALTDEQLQLRDAELRYGRESLHFMTIPDSSSASGELSAHGGWGVFQGHPSKGVLDPRAFFRVAGRDDLARAYSSQPTAATVSFVLGIASVAAACILLSISDDGEPGMHRPGWLALAGGTAGLAIGAYLDRPPYSVLENEAKALVADYNKRLRTRLGLPAVRRLQLILDMTLTQHAIQQHRGLALKMRF
jgi:hypothetical protein